ncbi:MAG: flavodoxin [Elusimicrobiaceae bacterium]|nr:flavodoxin [Elusimicrobiaceae bacterium]
MSKKLVAYFSASGITEKVAKQIADLAKADIYEIKPKVPYTEADLDWMNKSSRSSMEMKNLSFRPEMADNNIDISAYDTIYLGFPIWWYIAPTIVNTFLEKHDFSGKKIVLFATSGGSGLGKTAQHLKPSVAKDTIIIEGKILNSASSADIQNWLNSVK